MAFAKLTPAQITTMRSLRSIDEDLAKTMRAALFAGVKAEFGIPDEHKLKVEIDDTNSPDFGVLIRKKTGEVYTLGFTGKWVGAAIDQDDDPAAGSDTQPIPSPAASYTPQANPAPTAERSQADRPTAPQGVHVVRIEAPEQLVTLLARIFG